MATPFERYIDSIKGGTPEELYENKLRALEQNEYYQQADEEGKANMRDYYLRSAKPPLEEIDRTSQFGAGIEDLKSSGYGFGSFLAEKGGFEGLGASLRDEAKFHQEQAARYDATDTVGMDIAPDWFPTWSEFKRAAPSLIVGAPASIIGAVAYPLTGSALIATLIGTGAGLATNVALEGGSSFVDPEKERTLREGLENQGIQGDALERGVREGMENITEDVMLAQGPTLITSMAEAIPGFGLIARVLKTGGSEAAEEAYQTWISDVAVRKELARRGIPESNWQTEGKAVVKSALLGFGMGGGAGAVSSIVGEGAAKIRDRRVAADATEDKANQKALEETSEEVGKEVEIRQNRDVEEERKNAEEVSKKYDEWRAAQDSIRRELEYETERYNLKKEALQGEENVEKRKALDLAYEDTKLRIGKKYADAQAKVEDYIKSQVIGAEMIGSFDGLGQLALPDVDPMRAFMPVEEAVEPVGINDLTF